MVCQELGNEEATREARLMAKRADNRDGSCREILTGRQVGKWRVQFTLTEDTGFQRRISRIFATKTEAKQFLQDLRRGKRTEEVHRKSELTLREWFNWLAENDWPETLAGNTIGYRRGRFRKHIEPHMGSKPLSQIDAMQVRALFKHLREDGASESLIREIRSDLVRVFNQAISPYQQIPTTLANPFRLPLPSKKARDAVALGPNEVKVALARQALRDNQRAMLGVFLLGGLRLGEMMALTCGQVRLDSDLIVIDRAVRVEFGGKQTVGLPKGGKTRNAVMCETLKAILAPFIAGKGQEELLWPSATQNKPRRKKLVYATWRTILRDAKLPPKMTPHDCRLTHINIIEKLMPSVSTTTLKEHVGHSATGVTEANYTRPITSAQQILRDELERVLGFKGE